MAAPFQLVTPDRLQIREGGGGISLFGLPFFGAGVLMILVVFGVVPISNADTVAWYGWPLLGLMAIAFTAVGGVMVFGRSWTTIDIAQRVIVKQQGLLVPLREQTAPFDRYAAVAVGFVPGDSDTADRFPVTLKATSGAEQPLCNFGTYGESRACAAAVAQHLRVDLEDATSDHPIRLPLDSLSAAPLTRREKLRPSKTRPAETRSDVIREADGLRIIIPQPRLHPIVFLGGLIPAAIALAFARSLAVFFKQTHTPDAIGWTFLAFVVFGFAVLPLTASLNAFLRSRYGATIVRVSRSGILVQERTVWRTRRTAALDASEVLDLDYSARGLTVKTRQGFTTLAAGLDHDEVRYLYSVVLEGLRA